MGGFLLASLLSSGLLSSVQAATAPSFLSGREVWPGRRLVMLLPLQLSDNWNADVRWGQTLLRPSEAQLRKALEGTGKFSVVQPYRFDPILQRALLDKRIAKDQIEDLVTNPSLQSASSILGNLGFDLTPLIAEFRLEEVRASGSEKAPTIQVQVLGKLYPLNSQEADQTKVFTSDPERYRISQFDTVINAATNSFEMIAAEFVKPITEAVLPRVDPPPAIEKMDPKMMGKDKMGKDKMGKDKMGEDKMGKPMMKDPKTPMAPVTPTPPATSETPVSPETPAANTSNTSPASTKDKAMDKTKTPAATAAGASVSDAEQRVFVNPLNRGQLTRNP